MSAEPIYIQLIWEDPITNELKQPLLTPPIAIGREVKQIPEPFTYKSVSRLKLSHRQVSRFHALITLANNQLYITDRSANGTFLNGQRISKTSLPFYPHDTIRIGPYKITARLTTEAHQSATELNRDQTMFPHKSGAGDIQNGKLMIGFLGVVVLVLMTFGTWFAMNNILEYSRTQLKPNPASIQEQ